MGLAGGGGNREHESDVGARGRPRGLDDARRRRLLLWGTTWGMPFTFKVSSGRNPAMQLQRQLRRGTDSA